MKQLQKLRLEYKDEIFNEDLLKKNPFSQFGIWFAEALDVDPEPNAMILATVSPLGHPSTRSVLLKKWDKKGFCFFTNFQSRKAEQLTSNPAAASTFLWKTLHRQVLLEGKVEKLSRKEAELYFAKRPRGAQIAAHASIQSSPLASRDELEDAYAFMKKKFQGKKITCPKNWGGYRLVPHRFEFWQGRKDRLHDRILYVLNGKEWIISRLSP